tara:strand:+ start:1427 stop:2029 length:603 start_codon:yes stop_codon:yes gene_type:complete
MATPVSTLALHSSEGIHTDLVDNCGDELVDGAWNVPSNPTVISGTTASYSSAKKFFNPLEWEVLSINPPNAMRRKANTADLFCQDETNALGPEDKMTESSLAKSVIFTYGAAPANDTPLLQKEEYRRVTQREIDEARCAVHQRMREEAEMFAARIIHGNTTASSSSTTSARTRKPQSQETINRRREATRATREHKKHRVT